jgi:hypothetical protein
LFEGKIETHYKEIVTKDGLEAVSFTITTRRGFCTGLYIKQDDKIVIHLVEAKHGLKGLMRILVNKFHTKKVMFSPLITGGIENKVRGNISIVKAGVKGNPYGEDIKVLETEWE